MVLFFSDKKLHWRVRQKSTSTNFVHKYMSRQYKFLSKDQNVNSCRKYWTVGEIWDNGVPTYFFCFSVDNVNKCKPFSQRKKKKAGSRKALISWLIPEFQSKTLPLLITYLYWGWCQHMTPWTCKLLDMKTTWEKWVQTFSLSSPKPKHQSLLIECYSEHSVYNLVFI